jgi:hypothetical protein
MNTVLMAIAIIKDGNKILLRKVDPAKIPIKSLGLYLVAELMEMARLTS